MEIEDAVGKVVGAGEVGFGVAAGLTLPETVASMLVVATGVWARVVGEGAAELGDAVAFGSRGIAVGGLDLVHGTRDTRNTRNKKERVN